MCGSALWKRKRKLIQTKVNGSVSAKNICLISLPSSHCSCFPISDSHHWSPISCEAVKLFLWLFEKCSVLTIQWGLCLLVSWQQGVACYKKVTNPGDRPSSAIIAHHPLLQNTNAHYYHPSSVVTTQEWSTSSEGKVREDFVLFSTPHGGQIDPH